MQSAAISVIRDDESNENRDEAIEVVFSQVFNGGFTIDDLHGMVTIIDPIVHSMLELRTVVSFSEALTRFEGAMKWTMQFGPLNVADEDGSWFARISDGEGHIVHTGLVEAVILAGLLRMRELARPVLNPTERPN